MSVKDSWGQRTFGYQRNTCESLKTRPACHNEASEGGSSSPENLLDFGQLPSVFQIQTMKTFLSYQSTVFPQWNLDLDWNHTETVQMYVSKQRLTSTSFLLIPHLLIADGCSDLLQSEAADHSLRSPPKETTPLVRSFTAAQRNASSCGHPASLVSAAEPSRLHFGEQRDKSALLLFLFTPETWRTNGLCTCFLLRYHPQRTSPVFRPLKVRATSKHMKGGRCGVIKHSTKLCLENMCLKSVD